MKSKSMYILSSLIAVTFLMVNCQKAPSKRGVKAETLENLDVTGKPTGTATDGTTVTTSGTSGTSTSAQAQACDDKTVALRTELDSSLTKIKQLDKSQAAYDKAEIIKVEKSILNTCVAISNAMSQYNDGQCGLVINSNGTQKNFVVQASIIKDRCLTVSKDLQDRTGEKNELTVEVQKAVEVKKSEAELDKFMKFDLEIGDEGKILTTEDAINFEKYIVNGQIEYNNSSLKTDLSKNKVVCSFTSTETMELGDATVLKVLAIDEAGKDLLPEGFKGKASVVSLIAKGSGEDKTDTAYSLVCLNLDSKKVDTKQLAATFGQIIKVSQVKK